MSKIFSVSFLFILFAKRILLSYAAVLPPDELDRQFSPPLYILENRGDPAYGKLIILKQIHGYPGLEDGSPEMTQIAKSQLVILQQLCKHRPSFVAIEAFSIDFEFFCATMVAQELRELMDDTTAATIHPEGTSAIPRERVLTEHGGGKIYTAIYPAHIIGNCTPKDKAEIDRIGRALFRSLTMLEITTVRELAQLRRVKEFFDTHRGSVLFLIWGIDHDFIRHIGSIPDFNPRIYSMDTTEVD